MNFIIHPYCLNFMAYLNKTWPRSNWDNCLVNIAHFTGRKYFYCQIDRSVNAPVGVDIAYENIESQIFLTYKTD